MTNSTTVAFVAYLGNLLGILITKFGLFLQKLCLIELEKEGAETADPSQLANIKPVYKRLQWLVGLVLLLVGGGMQVVALPYADLVLISTNAITAILFNTFLSIRYLGEKFIWRYDVPALTLMSLGALVIVLVSEVDEKKFTPDDIRDLLTSLQSIIFNSIQCALLILTMVYLNVFLQQIKKLEADIGRWALKQTRLITPRNNEPEATINERLNDESTSIDSENLIDGFAEGIMPNHEHGIEVEPQVPRLLIRVLTIFPKELLLEISPSSERIRKSARLPMVSLLSCTGLLAGYSAVLFKYFAELVVGGKSLKVAALSFPILAAALFTNFLQLIFLNISMKYYDQLDVIPVFMTSFLVFGIVCGLIFFNEIESYTWGSGAGILGGCLLCIAGIALIVLKNAKVAKKNVRSGSEASWQSLDEL